MAQPVTNTIEDSATPRPPRTTFLPFALPHITQGEIDEVTDTLAFWLDRRRAEGQTLRA